MPKSNKSKAVSQKEFEMNTILSGTPEQVPSGLTGSVVDGDSDADDSPKPAKRHAAPSFEQSNVEVAGEEGADAAAVGDYPKASVPHDRIWSLYNAEATKYDTVLSERLKGSSDSLLIYAGLFSATVTAFIIESYKTLNMDPQDTAVLYLTFISQQLIASSGQSNTTSPPIPTPVFKSPTSSICANTLWVASLIFSLACALLATLVQSWLSRYARLVTKYPILSRKRKNVTGTLKASSNRIWLHWSRFYPACCIFQSSCFLAGLLIFFFPINLAVAYATSGVVASFGLLYLVFTVFPLIFQKSLYRTPFTAPASVIIVALVKGWLHVLGRCVGILWYLFGVYGVSPTSRPSSSPVPPSSPQRMALTSRCRRWIIGLPGLLSSLILRHSEHCLLWLKIVILGRPPSSVRRNSRSLEWLLNRMTSGTEYDEFIEGMLPMLLHDSTYVAHQVLSPFMTPILHIHQVCTSPLIFHFVRLLDSCSSVADEPLRLNQRRTRVEMCTGVLQQLFCRKPNYPDPCLSPGWIETCAPSLLLLLYRLRVPDYHLGYYTSDPFMILHGHLATCAVVTSILAHQQRTNTLFDGVTIYIPQRWSFDNMLDWLILQGTHMHVDLSFVTLGLLKYPGHSLLSWYQPSPVIIGTNPPVVLRPSQDVLGPPESEDEVVLLTPRLFANSCHLTLLNNLLTHLLTRGPTSNPPAVLTDMVEQTISSVYFAYNHGVPADKDAQRMFIQLLEHAVDRYIPSKSTSPGYLTMAGTESSIFGDAVVEAICQIADVLDDSECYERGRDAVENFEKKRSPTRSPSSSSSSGPSSEVGS